MKKMFFTLIMALISFVSFSQDDEYQKFIESQKKQMNEKKDAYNNGVNQMNKEYQTFVEKQNAEFAEFVAKQWELFEEFAKESMSYTLPKIKTAPVATKTDDAVIVSKEITYAAEEELPKVTHAVAVAYEGDQNNSYEVKTRIGDKGAEDLPTKDFDKSKKFRIDQGTDLRINFYGREIPIHFDRSLKIKSVDIEEKNVADYFTRIAKCQNETKALWAELTAVVDEFGLNEWGYFCLLRSVSEQVFENVNDRVRSRQK